MKRTAAFLCALTFLSLALPFQSNGKPPEYVMEVPLPQVPARMEVYETADPDILGTLFYVAGVFGVYGQVIQEPGLTYIEDRDKTVEVFDSGAYWFTDDSRVFVPGPPDPTFGQNIPEDSLTVFVRSFLRDHRGLMPQGSFLVIVPEGVTLTEFQRCDAATREITRLRGDIHVNFGMRILGENDQGSVEIVGPGAKIEATVDDNGIAEVLGVWRELNPSGQKEIISPEQALESFKRRGLVSLIRGASKNTQKVRIQHMDVAYLTEPAPEKQESVGPVYVFAGKFEGVEQVEEFLWYEPALKIVVVPKQLKEEARARLDSLLSTVVLPKKAKKHIKSALKHLEKSLKYLDDSGAEKKFFDEEEKAVKELKKGATEILKKGGKGVLGAADEAQEVAARMTSADEALATIALEEAEADPGADPKKIEKARKELGKAYKELQNSDKKMAKLGLEWYRYDKAIDHFKKAWQHAQRAKKTKPVLLAVTPQAQFALFENTPDPFSRTTSIRYQIPAPTHTSLRVYDRTGRLIRTLMEEHKETGYYRAEWDGMDEANRPVPSGIYFYRLRAGKFTDAKKMTLLR